MAVAANATMNRTVRQVMDYKTAITEPQAALGELLDYTVPCPLCDKRVFDISELPVHAVRLRMKCPHCRRLFLIPCAAGPP